MSNKKDIRKDVDGLREEVLSTLSTDKRASLAIEKKAEGDDESLQTLVDTLEMSVYQSADPDFFERMALLETVAVYALWELDSAASEFAFRSMAYANANLGSIAFPDDDSYDPESSEQEWCNAAGIFLSEYNAWKRFAIEDLDVSLTHLLKFPFEDEIDERITRIESLRMEADESAVDDSKFEEVEGDLSLAAAAEFDVDELAEKKYQTIKSRV